MTDALNKVFRREHFEDGTGGYFSAVRADPSKYLQKCSDITKKWLRNLKAHGKMVFLQTSSHADYATLLLEYILGSDWESYFDLSIMYARKPGFFLAKNPTERPFYTIKNCKEDNPVLEIGSEKCYLQGNIHSFNEYMQKKIGKDKPKVVYVGDSLRSDVWPTNLYAGWASVLVLEEMEAEGLIDDTVSDEESSDEEEEGPPAKLAKMKHPSVKEREFLLSSVWGSFFVDNKPTVCATSQSHNSSHDATDSSNSKKSPELVDSLWGHLVKTFSTIAVPTVEHVAVFHIDHEFKTFANDDSGTAGFYPSMPRACKQ
ncbi:5'-nucleotidase domain-containing protein 1-like [Amphiura filiformis]|uniref:5'-nucleotidase domain-containing protein 1-like n=1 Tax=Amphiura filiformis TaxID=82378 RepID=UPI003B22572D